MRRLGADARLGLAVVLAAGGSVLLGAGVLANYLQVGGSPDFGYKQLAAVLVGGAALAVGVAAFDSPRARDLWRARPAALRVAALAMPYAAVGAYAAYLGIKLRPNVMYDDAAITFRYVDRLTSGHGFTYNDHEHVLGASNPLYTLILAVAHLLGVGIEHAAEAVCLGSFVGSVLLATYIAAGVSNLAGGVVAGLLLASQDYFRYQALSGMESSFGLLLGLLVVACLLRERDTWAGAFLGLAIWNKVDAGLLALAVALASLAFRRRFPVRVAVVSALVVAPWAIFALAYFGSPLPHSFSTKLSHGDPASAFDRTWIVDFFRLDYRWVPVALGAVSLAFLRAMSPAQRVVVATLAGWFAFHGLAFSLIDLGDPYPWYLTILFAPPAILTGVTCGRLAGLTPWAGGAPRVAALAAALCLPVALGFALVSARAPLQLARAELRAHNPPEPFETFDDDRRLAGIWLDRYAGDREVLSTCWGWTAYESHLPFDDTCLLNTKRRLEPKTYVVLHGTPHFAGSVPPADPEGYVRVATFDLASDLFPGWSWFNVYALADSRIARAKLRYVQYRLFELAPPRGTPGRSLPARVAQGLVAAGPSAATFTVRNEHQPVHVVFVPALDGVSRRTAFEVRAGRERVARRVLTPSNAITATVANVRGAAAREVTPITFTTSAPGGWHEVKLIVGGAYLDADRIPNSTLRDAWRSRNPSR